MIQIRSFCLEDTPVIVALFRDTVRRINRQDYSREQVLAWAPDEIDLLGWSDRLASRFSVVADKNGQIVGFGDLEGDGHLDHLYVHADHQGCGVGRALLLVLEAEARQQGHPRVFTEASITARPFFERQGYRVLQEQEVVFRGVSFVNYRMEKPL